MPVDLIGGKSPKYHATYDRALQQAMRHLLKYTTFGGSNDARKYNKQHWKTGKDRDGDEILILTSSKPSVAVQDIFKYPGRWSFDCIEIIQVGRWYAALMAMGDKEFDHQGNGGFKLSYHETSGLRGRLLYRRERKRDTFESTEGLTGRKMKTDVKLTTAVEEDEFLKKLPIGTRVMWSDTHEDAQDTDFENENTIKVGEDLYAAHPFVHLSAAKIRKALGPSSAEVSSKARRDAYVRRYVFVQEIEWNAKS